MSDGATDTSGDADDNASGYSGSSDSTQHLNGNIFLQTAQWERRSHGVFQLGRNRPPPPPTGTLNQRLITRRGGVFNQHLDHLRARISTANPVSRQVNEVTTQSLRGLTNTNGSDFSIGFDMTHTRTHIRMARFIVRVMRRIETQ